MQWQSCLWLRTVLERYMITCWTSRTGMTKVTTLQYVQAFGPDYQGCHMRLCRRILAHFIEYCPLRKHTSIWTKLSTDKRLGIFLYHDGVAAHFGRQYTSYMNWRFPCSAEWSCWSISRPARSPKLTPNGLCLWTLKTGKYVKLLCRIVSSVS